MAAHMTAMNFLGKSGSTSSLASGISHSSLSGLRHLASSPMNRFGRKQSRPASIASASTRSSLDSRAQTSCVDRDTSRDECGLHRFIVWVAVKRNLCDRITDDEKRECPLVRCKRQFCSHELMLQHLYACPELPSGEYLCYDCNRTEHFIDSKCRRNMESPSRRKKIMSMAKNFFSNLGHRSQNGSLADLTIETMPSLVSLGVDQAELQSQEIFEIDSTEVKIQDAAGLETPAASIRTTPVIIPNRGHVTPAAMVPAELDSLSSLGESLVEWESPFIIEPPDLILDERCGGHNSNYGRPTLHVTTRGSIIEPHPCRRHPKPRRRDLAPSSSVRSTSSTNSSNSTSSTVSSISCFSNTSTATSSISPISIWNDPWASAYDNVDCSMSEMVEVSFNHDEGHIASLGLWPGQAAERLCSDGGLLGGKGLEDLISQTPMHPSVVPSVVDAFLTPPLQPFPMMDMFPDQQLSFDIQRPTFDVSHSTANPPDNNVSIATSSSEEDRGGCLAAVKTLIESSWGVLREHILMSKGKITHLPRSPLADQLKVLSPQLIASGGLKTLKLMLKGGKVTQPMEMLCFAHVAYALSLILDDQQAAGKWEDMHRRVLSYGRNAPFETQEDYAQVANAIWQPTDLARRGSLSQTESSTAASRSNSRRANKGAADEGRVVYNGEDEDVLVAVSRCFLDELEHSMPKSDPTYPKVTGDKSDKAGTLTGHIADISLNMCDQLSVALDVLGRLLWRKFAAVPGLEAHIKSTLRGKRNSTVRHVELEFLQAGKAYLPWRLFFNDYAPLVRKQFDALYGQPISGFVTRLPYYTKAIDLMDSIVTTACLSEACPSGIFQDGRAGSEGNPTATTTWSASSTPMELGGVSPQIPQGFRQGEAMRGLMTTPAAPVVDEPQKDEQSQSPLGLSPNLGLDLPSSPAQQQDEAGGVSDPAEEEEAAPNRIIEAQYGCCDICGYQPKGDSRWFKGSMAKHKKIMHASTPPKIYKCPFPGCSSQYKSRPDNLRQHQLDKGHMIDDQAIKRPQKRKKINVAS